MKNRDSGFIKIDRIATEENIPLNYLRKIFQNLIKHKMVTSGVGPSGGVRFPENKPDISAADVIYLFDGEPDLGECTLFGAGDCLLGEACPIHDECRHFQVQAWEKLKNFEIESFLKT